MLLLCLRQAVEQEQTACFFALLVHLAAPLLLNDCPLQKLAVLVVDGLAASHAQLEPGILSLHCHLMTLVVHLEKSHAVGEAGVNEFDGGGQFYCSSNDHAQLCLVFGLAPVLDLGDGELFNALLST